MAIRQPTVTEIDTASFVNGQYTFPVESIIEPERGFGKLTIRASEGWLVATRINPEPSPLQELGHVRQPDGSRLVKDEVTLSSTGAQPHSGTVTLTNPLQEVCIIKIVSENGAQPVGENTVEAPVVVEKLPPVITLPVQSGPSPNINDNTGDISFESPKSAASSVAPFPNVSPTDSPPNSTKKWLIGGGIGILAISLVVVVYLNSGNRHSSSDQTQTTPVPSDSTVIAKNLLEKMVGNYAFRLKRNANDSISFNGTARLELHPNGTYWLMGESPDNDLKLEYQCKQVSTDALLLTGEFSYNDSPTNRAHGVNSFQLHRETNGSWLSVATLKLPGLQLTPSN